MRRRFNVNGLCYPEERYMVNLDSRMRQIRQLVDDRKYFVINRARQFGKTTVLWALKTYLRKDYIVLSMSFQRMSAAVFQDEYTFAGEFANMILRMIGNPRQGIEGFSQESVQALRNGAAAGQMNLAELFHLLSVLCDTADRPVVLMIDEVDSASNNQVFLDFLGILRDYYLDRKQSAIFHSVILAGVYDIKNLKQKIRPDETHRYNSPWNIAADFTIDLGFDVQDVEGMLREYEEDHQTGMDIRKLSTLICDYTSGYPYLVSRICMLIDERIMGEPGFTEARRAWSDDGVMEAVKLLLNETNTLFDDMRKRISDYPELKKMLYAILFDGQSFVYNPDNFVIELGKMFGFLKEKDNQVVVANRVFETRLYNLFLSEEALGDPSYQAAEEMKNQFVTGGRLNMELVMTKFMEHFTELYGDSEERFREENGRRLFLLFLKPIINGTGNYYIEAQTRNQRRTDVVIDYLGRQYVVEMKIWRGEEYNRRGEQQLANYLEAYHLDKGYLLSFNFNKNKKVGAREIRCGGKLIFEVVV